MSDARERFATERRSAVLRMLEEAKRLTDELLRDNAALRQQQRQLRAQVRDLETLAAQVPRARLEELEEARAKAERELAACRCRLLVLEEENFELVARYERIARQNGALASLHAASNSLHERLDFNSVLDAVREIVINLLGSEMFGVYLFEDPPTTLLRVAHEGLDGERFLRVPASGLISQAVSERRVLFGDGTEQRPLAVVPLCAHDIELGALIIYGLLDHKAEFNQLDRELTELIAAQASVALYAARAFTGSERRRPVSIELRKLGA